MRFGGSGAWPGNAAGACWEAGIAAVDMFQRDIAAQWLSLTAKMRDMDGIDEMLMAALPRALHAQPKVVLVESEGNLHSGDQRAGASDERA